MSEEKKKEEYFRKLTEAKQAPPPEPKGIVAFQQTKIGKPQELKENQSSSETKAILDTSQRKKTEEKRNDK